MDLAFKLIPLNILFTFLCSLAYTRIHKFTWKKGVPKGFGSIASIIFFISIYTYKSDNYISLFLPSLIVIVLMTLIYYLDDLFELSPFIRMVITSITITLLINMPIGLDFLSKFPSLYLIIFCILLISSIVLVNVSNFYDGSNLNLSSLIFLMGFILILFNEQNLKAYDIIGSCLLGISIGFGILNCRLIVYILEIQEVFICIFILDAFNVLIYCFSRNIFSLFALIALPVFDFFM